MKTKTIVVRVTKADLKKARKAVKPGDTNAQRCVIAQAIRRCVPHATHIQTLEFTKNGRSYYAETGCSLMNNFDNGMDKLAAQQLPLTLIFTTT